MFIFLTVGLNKDKRPVFVQLIESILHSLQSVFVKSIGPQATKETHTERNDSLFATTRGDFFLLPWVVNTKWFSLSMWSSNRTICLIKSPTYKCRSFLTQMFLKPTQTWGYYSGIQFKDINTRCDGYLNNNDGEAAYNCAQSLRCC